MQRLQNLPKWIDGIWLVLLALYIVAGTSSVPFHGDESTLIYMGRDYYYHFIEGDISKLIYDKAWSISPDEQYLRLLNGTIPKYSFGGVTAFSGNSIEDINEQWDWGADYNYNHDTERIPENNLLFPARMVSAIQHTVMIATAFIIAVMIFNRPIAYFTSLYLTLNPALLMNGRRAMMEGSHLMFMMLAILIAILLVRYRKWWLFILYGVICGLAVAAKHPNVVVVTLLFIALGSYILFSLIRQKATVKASLRYIGLLIISGIIALSTFYSLNPAWWGTPIESAQTVLRLRNELLDIQIDIYGDYPSTQAQVNGFFDFVFVAQPQYYEVPAWASYSEITSQIQSYETSFLSGVAIGGSTIGGLLMLSIVGFGVIHFAQNKNILLAYRWLILVWGVGICVITFILTPLAWARYYLPIIPFVGMMLAYGVFTLLSLFQKRFISEKYGFTLLD